MTKRAKAQPVNRTPAELKAEFVRRLFVHLNQYPITAMDLGTATEAMVEFCASGLFYMFEATQRLDLITGDDVGGEIARMIKAMKRLRGGEAQVGISESANAGIE